MPDTPFHPTPPRRRRKRLGMAVSLVVTLVGLFFAAKGAQELQRAYAGRSWPSAEALILSGEIDRDTRIEPRGVTSTTHQPRIRYSYTVDGRAYTGERVGWTHGTTETGARSLLERFRPGARVPVHYDPQNPADAVLVRDGMAGLWAVVAFGLAFAAIGFSLFRRLRARRD